MGGDAVVGAAALPPRDLSGLDPSWSRLVDVEDADGGCQTWHVLDNGATPEHATMLCVHGNPTWSYLWRRFLAGAPPGWRVIAVDQLGMGFSARTDPTAGPRRFAERVADLDDVTRALGVTGPVVTVGHDWGGLISVAWALRHHAGPNATGPNGTGPNGIVVRGIVLANTALRQPVDAPVPPLIRLARSPALRRLSCAATPLFVAATAAISRPPLPVDVRAALRAPYRGAGRRGIVRRQAVEDFVADIPLEAGHPSRAAFDAVTGGLAALADVPALVVWGARDPVFTDRYLQDVLTDLPHAQVHRYPRAGHLVTEDVPEIARHAWEWVTGAPPVRAPSVPEPPVPEPSVPEPHRSLWAELDARAGEPAPAVVERGGRGRHVSFDLLQRRVHELAAGLAAVGVRPGHRVALLVPPGADLVAAAYACWRVGAVTVLADQGLGPRGLAAALRGAAPDHVIGVPRGLLLAKALGVPGRRIVAGPATALTRRLLDAGHSLAELARRGRSLPPPAEPAAALPDPDGECAVLFTSGATGPAKGVVYRHRQVRAQLDILRDTLAVNGEDRIVAAFPPFALYAPALGIAAVVPDVTAPGRLTAVALAEAAAAAEATVVFASPAALRGVLATADDLREHHRAALGRIRLVASAGAPVPAALLHALGAVLPAAVMHTPYGMTEALPVTDITLAEIDAAGAGDGVCVGLPRPGIDVGLSPLDGDGAATGPLTVEPGVTGEICVRGPHVKDRYDRLWITEQASTRDPGWHHTGDVGHLDAAGRLWVEGRLGHVVTHASGPVTPVGVEQRVQRLAAVDTAVAVGVGPRGTQQLVVVVVTIAATRGRSLLAPPPLAAAVRAAVQPADERDSRRCLTDERPVRRGQGVEVAAVLVTDALPVDIRHASKVDRARVAAWAERVLSGQRAGRRP